MCYYLRLVEVIDLEQDSNDSRESGDSSRESSRFKARYRAKSGKLLASRPKRGLKRTGQAQRQRGPARSSIRRTTTHDGATAPKSPSEAVGP